MGLTTWSAVARADPLDPPRGRSRAESVPEAPVEAVPTLAAEEPASVPVRPDAVATDGVLWLALLGIGLALFARRGLVRDLAGRWSALRAGLRPGTWVEIDGQARRVFRVGPTAVWTYSGTALRRTPLRRFAGAPLAVDAGRWPAVTVLLTAPTRLSPDEVAERLRRAVTRAAQAAPDAAPVVAPDPVTHRLWRVTCRLLDPDLKDAFAAVLWSHLDKDRP